MILKQIKMNCFSLYTLLSVVIMSSAWYYGASVVFSNIALFKSATPAIFRDIENSINGFSVFCQSDTFYMVSAAVLLSGLFLSGAFLYDKNTGIGNSTITRIGFNKYFSSKLISVFLSSFLTIAFSLTLILICCLLKYSAKLPSELFDAEMPNLIIEAFFFKHPYIVTGLVICNISFVVSLFTVLGLSFSSVISNRFVVSIMPFVLYIFGIVFPQLFDVRAPIAKVFVWIFPQYFYDYFVRNDFWYSKLPLMVTYCIHALVLIIPTIVLTYLLYSKNRRQYIR